MLYKFKEGSLWGMINEKGQVVVKPIYLRISDFIGDYALGTMNEKWFYINEEGNVVKRFNVNQMSLFNEGMAKMNLCGSIGYINKKFQVVIEPRYGLYSSCFNEGLALVCTPKINENKLYGFINHKGQQVIDFKYESAGVFSEGLAVVIADDKYGAIDKSGKLIIEYKYNWLNYFKEGRAFFEKDNLWGIVDNKGNEIVQASFEEDEDNSEHYIMQDFSEGFAVICQNSKYGYIDREGNIVTDIIYDYASSFNEGIALVRMDNKWFALDKFFNIIAGLHCQELRNFSDGLAAICVNGKWGFIDKIGDIVIEVKYNEVFYFNNGIAATVLDGKYGYIDKTGKEFFRAEKFCEEPYYCSIF